MKIFNLRYGFATNSSSSHSLVVFNDPSKIQGTTGAEQEFGWEHFVAHEKDEKLRYLGQMVRKSLSFLPERAAVLATSQLMGYDVSVDGYVDHQSCYVLPLTYGSVRRDRFIDEQFLADFQKYLVDSKVTILGGSDNDSSSHPLSAVAHRDVSLPIPRYESSTEWVCRKDRKIWTLFAPKSGTKVRFSFDDDVDCDRVSSPELVDLKITNWCDTGCSFCYQNSTVAGSHADSTAIIEILKALAKAKVFEVAIGGGEPTKHPAFADIISACVDNGIVPNFTTRSIEWVDQGREKEIWDNCGGIAYSVSDQTSLDGLRRLNDRLYRKKILQKNTSIPTKVSIHIPMGTITREFFERVLRYADEEEMAITLLGYKKVGRGKDKDPIDYSWWLECVQTLYDQRVHVKVGIDTHLAQEFQKQLDDEKIPHWLYRTVEGEHSCYIDCVTQHIAASSYGEQKTFLLKEASKQHWGNDNALTKEIKKAFATFRDK